MRRISRGKQGIGALLTMASVVLSGALPGAAAPIHDATLADDIAKMTALLDADSTLVNAPDPERTGSTPLQLAAQYGKRDAARLLLARGADRNARDAHGAPPIRLAARNYYKNVVDLLLASGASDDVFAATRNTGIGPHGATVSDRTDRLARLLRADPRLAEARNDEGKAPLHWAAWDANMESAAVLLAAGADINAKDREGTTPLHTALELRHAEMARWLVARGANVRARGPQDWTPMHYILTTDTARLLIRAGVDVNARCESGDTPLHIAASGVDRDLVRFLLASGAKLDATNGSGWTALHAAWNREMAALLMDRGLSPKTPARDGKTPLHIAAWNRNEGLAALLLARGADLHAGDRDGLTPLGEATLAQKPEMVRFLTLRGAKPDIFAASATGNAARVAVLLRADPRRATARAGTGGRTPLDLASEFGHPAVARLVLDAGASVDGGVKRGDARTTTPLHRAAEKGHTEIVALLLARGADPTIGDNAHYGATALMLARDHPDIIALLKSHAAGTMKR